MENFEMIGLCKECTTTLYPADEIPEYKGIFECPHCSYPNAYADMFYLTEKQYNYAMKQLTLLRELRVEEDLNFL